MKLLYFAWIRERTGVAQEEISPDAGVSTVEQLIHWLAARGGGYEAAFSDLSVVRVAVNQDYVTMDHAVVDGDEVAFFPPVTGG